MQHQKSEYIDDWLKRNVVGDRNPIEPFILPYAISRIKTPFIKAIGNTFSQNIENTIEMCRTPIYMACISEVDKIQTEIETLLAPMGTHFLSAWPDIESLANQLAAVENWNPGTVEQIAKDFKATPELTQLMEDFLNFYGFLKKINGEETMTLLRAHIKQGFDRLPDAIKSFDRIFYAAHIQYWMAFEILATDLWESFINNFPQKSLQKIINDNSPHFNQDTHSKFIPLHTLSRYNFDLTNSMGTILKPKFNFTSIQGILKAYEKIEKAAWLNKELKDQLQQIELKRHLLVHRAGVTDDDFIRKSKGDYELGKAILIDEGMLYQTRHAVIQSGLTLLRHLDSLAQNQNNEKS